MEILGFLVVLGCLVVIVWVIVLVTDAVFGRKRRQQNRHQKPPSLTPPKIQERNSSQSTITAPPPPSAPLRRVVPFRQPPVSTRVRLPSSRHQQYIRLAERVLEQLRDGEVQLPKALGILRKMNPYAFEELLLTCCQNQGWKIERNFRYMGDDGLDGRVIIAGRLYLIQAKRYRGYINLKHIHDFHRVIQRKEAMGGFFIHTGRTSELSKELLREYRITLLSGQRLVNLVLGQRLRILE